MCKSPPVTPAEAKALEDARGYALANRLEFEAHARLRMQQRAVMREDVRSALATAQTCSSEAKRRWKATGLDTFGDALTVVFKLQDGVLVVTVFRGRITMPKQCVACDSREIEEAEVEDRFELGGRTFAVVLPGMRCAHCGDTYLDYEAMGLLERAVAEQLARHGEVDGHAFRYMRKVIAMPVAEVAALLDVSSNKVTGWENGEEPVDRKASVLLSMMVLDWLEGLTTTVDRLRAAASPKPWPDGLRLLPKRGDVEPACDSRLPLAMALG